MAVVINIFHEGKEVFTADMVLLSIGQESIERRGNEFASAAGAAGQDFVQAGVLLRGASEGDGFLVHGGCIVTAIGALHEQSWL